ncbi:MAG: hypothetical protein ACQEXJ_14775 [Myxococcota bacterium]
MIRPAAVAACALLTAGCDLPGVSGVADFVDEPFGEAVAPVQDLDGEALEPVMTEVLVRFRSYLALREALPFAGLADDEACLRDVEGGGDDFRFTVDLACRFGAASPASGSVDVDQRVVAGDPVEVVELDVTYREAQVGELRVDGTEDIRETSGEDGTSVRTLDLVQDGLGFDYRFRLGQVDPETPVFDYVFELEEGAVRVRMTNPSEPGAFATVRVTGVDGTLTCEIGDTAWAPGDAAKGTCDNGASFGFPDRSTP